MKLSLGRKRLNIELFKKVYRIRRAERGIIEHYHEDEMKTPMHMSMGEEAIVAGVLQALGKEDIAFGYYRSHALYIAKADDTDKFFAEMYGKVTGTVRGKGGSMHLVAPVAGLFGISAVVASTIAPAVGSAFANKMKGNGRVVAAFFGDGAAEEGVFWESLNVACLMQLPVIFVCEDNGLAVDVTKAERQGFRSLPKAVGKFNCHVIASKSTEPETIHGLAQKAMRLVRTGDGPVFIHLQYCRYLQHIGVSSDFDSSSSTPAGGFERTGYRDKKEFDRWYRRDPLKLQRNKLLALGVRKTAIDQIEREIDAEIEESIRRAKAAPFPDASELYHHVFFEPRTPVTSRTVAAERPGTQAEDGVRGGRLITFADAINEALRDEMARDPSVFVYGVENKVFGTHRGLAEQFGEHRSFSTPLSEEAMTGFGLGAALNGLRPVHAHIRVDFLVLALNQIINMISSYCYGSAGALNVPMVIRAIVGRGWGQGFQHSKSLHSLFAHIPGLKVVMPTTPYDAKGLLTAAIRDDNPVITIEHRWLHWQEGEVPEAAYTVPIGPANRLRNGSDITVVATSWMNVEAAQAADILARRGISVEIIDARTIAPFDDSLIVESVEKTGRCLVADNDWLHCGFSAEVAARVSEKCFGSLKSPVRRIGFAATPCPTVRVLENAFYPNAGHIVRAIEEVFKLTPTDLAGEDLYSHENRFKGPF